MSQDLLPYMGGTLTRESRRTARAVSRHQMTSQVRVAGVDTETDIALAKVDALTHTTGQAMSAVVRVAVAQRQAELMAPEAAARLNILADDHCLSMTDIMADLRRKLRWQ